MGNKIELVEGMKFGHLTYLHEVEPKIDPSGKKRRRVEVKCSCGRVFVTNLENIIYSFRKRGDVKCLSCSISEKNRVTKLKHGVSCNPLYTVWHGIIDRCNNPNNKQFKDYGGRGIAVCKEWSSSPKPFVEWGLSHGYKDGLQIDRVDNNKGYSPDNCRFVTRRENSNNKRNTHYIEGEPSSLWFEKQYHHPSVTYSRFHSRYFILGWDLNRSLLTPNRYFKLEV